MSNERIPSDRALRICVCGLGYVGAVTAACLARLEHFVIGVDVVPSKVKAINDGKAHFVEHGLAELTASMVSGGRLSGSTDAASAIRQSDMTVICVGTPSQEDGSINTEFVRTMCYQVGEALRSCRHYHVVVIRSTVLPGVTRRELIPLIEKTSGKTAGVEFGVCFNPEFLREGNAIEDFFHPSRTVIGEYDKKSGDALVAMYAHEVSGPKLRVTVETAEMVKYTDNWWHAIKVAFANEVGTLAQTVQVDAVEVMRIFMLDSKLNISTKYLLPGLPFGGSCLPKDLRALTHLSRRLRLNLPLLEAVLPSNTAHLARSLEAIRAAGCKTVGFLGLTFKPGTDDVRESPAVEMIATLLDEGYDVLVHDGNVNPVSLIGANKLFLLKLVPHLPRIMVEDPETLCRSAEVLVKIHDTAQYSALIEKYRGGHAVVDCTRLCMDETIDQWARIAEGRGV